MNHLTKEESQQFLKSGGVLLRTGISRKGTWVLKRKEFKRDWSHDAAFETKEQAEKALQQLLKSDPDKYKED